MSVSRNNYYDRFAAAPRQILTPPRSDLGLVVVIPCFNEPDLIGSLESLRTCEPPECSVEVIVVINSASNSAPEILEQNRQTLDDTREWTRTHLNPRFLVHLLQFLDLPPKHAGVGLARKLGMDEAVRRFDDIGHPEGIVACYDADCRCDPNYLASLEQHFREHPCSPGCSIYFEHPLEGNLERAVYDGIAVYELHLRYYVQALRYSGFPYAYHTVGSSMAVRAGAYQRQGGMNKRQAGEDFYFLHKIISLGDFTNLSQTRVIPSPRPSDRVPFGTGKAVRAFMEQGRIGTYPLEAFRDLKGLFDLAPDLCHATDHAFEAVLQSAPDSLRTFLRHQHFANAWKEIRENTSSESAFVKRFFQWFNGFRAMKFVHHARDHFYGEQPVDIEANRLLQVLPSFADGPAQRSIRELLQIYRVLDRNA